MVTNDCEPQNFPKNDQSEINFRQIEFIEDQWVKLEEPDEILRSRDLS